MPQRTEWYTVFNMHRIFSNGKESPCIGGKAGKLILIDRFRLTPDFIVLSYDFLKDEFGVGRADVMKKCSAEFMRKILEAAEWLGGENLIVRSSCACEDGDGLSYAGMFSSEICSACEELPVKIKKVWNSRFSGRAEAYRCVNGGNVTEAMGIIIQKYITPEYGGVMFYDPARNTAYAETSAGDVSHVVSGEAETHGYLNLYERTFLTSSEGLCSVEFVDEIAMFLKELSAEMNGIAIDAEFAVAGGRYYILQARPLTAEADPFARDYVFPLRAERSNFAPGDEDIVFMEDILKKYALPVPVFYREGSDLKISGPELKALAAAVRNLAFSSGFALRFKKDFMEMLHRDGRSLKAVAAWNIEKIIHGIKNLNFRFFFMDLLHVAVQKEAERVIENFTRTGSNKKYLDMLKNIAPERTFTDKKLGAGFGAAGVNSNYSGFEADMEQLKKILDARSGKGYGADPESSVRETSACPVQEIKPEIIENLRILIDLRDRIDYHFAAVSSVYHKIISCKTRYRGNISGLCLLDNDDIKRVLAGEKIQKKPARQIRIKREFPLRGMTASAGTAEGPATVINSLEDMRLVSHGDIIVARYTRPDLMIAMAKAAAIVTETGGLTSHAAITSRELGIPCLVGCAGCTSEIHNGDIVRISNGFLHMIRRAAV